MPASRRPPAPLESVVVGKIISYLRSQGAFAEKVHGDALQAGLLDIIACYKGRMLHLEVKRAPGIPPTPRQAYIITQVQAAGGISATVSSVSDVSEILANLDLNTYWEG